jgi:uroporphyrinogen decarboxylase
MASITSRERIRRVLSGGVPDRVPIHDTYWETTVLRWWSEGLPREVSPEEYFQTEIVRIAGDYTLQLPVRMVEETERTRSYWDSNGALRKDLRTGDGWTPQWLDYTIKNKEDWLRYRHQAAFHPSRIPATVQGQYQQARAQGKFIVYSGHACFHPTWAKIGMENELEWMVEQPDFISDLFTAQTQLMIDIYEGMRRLGLEFDGAWFNDDLGWRRAPLISPRMYRELVFPHHKRLCDYFANQGLKTMLHTDGNVAPLIPQFLEAGFVALHPLEAKAGLDVRDLKKQYGHQLVLLGNIDVRAMADPNPEVLEEEIRSKITAAKEGGGYIYHSDHSVPADVSFTNYCRVIELVHRYGRYEEGEPG